MGSTTRYKILNVTASGTTTVKSGTGYVHNISWNSGTGTPIVVYDSTTAGGTTIATLDTLSENQGTLPIDGQFNTGLTISTGGACDLTVTYE